MSRLLEQLIREVTHRAVVETVQIKTRDLAERLTQEEIWDEQAKRELRDLVRAGVHEAWQDLIRRQKGNGAKRRATKKGKR